MTEGDQGIDILRFLMFLFTSFMFLFGFLMFLFISFMFLFALDYFICEGD